MALRVQAATIRQEAFLHIAAAASSIRCLQYQGAAIEEHTAQAWVLSGIASAPEQQGKADRTERSQASL